MTIYQNDGHGIYLNGSDANAGYFIGGDLGGNGSPVSDHNWTGIGYNIYDSSFLGNTYVQAQMASGGIGSVFNDSIGGGGTFVGCYVEGAGGGESRVGNGTSPSSAAVWPPRLSPKTAPRPSSGSRGSMVPTIW